MTTQDEQSLKNEIQHIFDSGANEVRILEMVKSFIKKRGQALYIHDVSDCIIEFLKWRNGELPHKQIKTEVESFLADYRDL